MSLEGQALRRGHGSEPKWRVAPGGREVSCYIQQQGVGGLQQACSWAGGGK